MRMKRWSHMAAVLALAGTAHAGDTLKVEDATLTPGDSVTLAIGLESEATDLMGWQCDIVLPEGLALAVAEDGSPSATLGGRFAPTAHAIFTGRTEDGAYRFVAMSMEAEAIPADSSPLFTVTLQAENATTTQLPDTTTTQLPSSPSTQLPVSPGATLTGSVANIEFITQDNRRLSFPDASFSVVICPASAGRKCATPSIAYAMGELLFQCETEGASFVSEVVVADAGISVGERKWLDKTYQINVYATCEGYDASDVATATIGWRNGKPLMEGFSRVSLEYDENAADVNDDGTIDVADIATIISEMARLSRIIED